MTDYSLGSDLQPKLPSDAWVAPGAVLIENVVMKPASSVWFGAVVRAENDQIVIGEGSNIPVSYTHLTLPTILLV